MARRHLGAFGVLALVTGLVAAGPARGLSVEEAILPLESHAAPEARALAWAHAAEFRALYAEVMRCGAGLDVHRHGIAFQRPRGNAAAPPHLTLWVWLDRTAPPGGTDLAVRASDAFRHYGRALVRRLMARSPVFADPRVGGYGLILTWLSPIRKGERLVAESLAVFADKLTAANFAHDTISAATFLARAEVRVFEGQTELAPPRLSVDDSDMGRDPPPC